MVPASVRIDTDVDVTNLVRVLAACETVAVENLVARLVTIAMLPDCVTSLTEEAKEVDKTVEVEAFSVVPGRPALVLVAVTQDVCPGRVKIAVLVNCVTVELTVIVVVPAARASRPLRKKRAAGEGAQVMVDFFVVVWIEVYETVLVCGLAVVVFSIKLPDREMVLVMLEPFCVLVMYEV